MMGRLERDQGRLFYSFCLDEVVPDDHRAREIAAVLDLSWLHTELGPPLLAPWPSIDRPSACVACVVVSASQPPSLGVHGNQKALRPSSRPFGPFRSPTSATKSAQG